MRYVDTFTGLQSEHILSGESPQTSAVSKNNRNKIRKLKSKNNRNFLMKVCF